MSDAKKTIESSIIEGLSKNAHKTGATITVAHIQVPDILKAMFDPSVRWSVKEYLAELDADSA